MCTPTLVTKEAPDFYRLTAPVLPDNTLARSPCPLFAAKNVILFFYPLDLYLVCPSEILAFNKKLDEFKKAPTPR